MDTVHQRDVNFSVALFLVHAVVCPAAPDPVLPLSKSHFVWTDSLLTLLGLTAVFLN